MSQLVADEDHPQRPQQRYANLYTDLARTVRELGLLRRRHGYYWTRIGLVIAAFAAVWVGFGLLGNSWFQLLMAGALAVVLTQVAFLSHDSAHRQIFDSATWNDWTARLLASGLVGMSVGWWRSKHSRHHQAPNQMDRDPDIGAGVVAFTPADATERRRSQRLAHPPPGLAVLPAAHPRGPEPVRREPPTSAPPIRLPPERIEAAIILTRLGGYVAVLLLLLPIGKAGAFLGLQLAVFGICLGASFAPNHKGMPLVPATMKLDFLRRQVLMSRNIRGGVMVDFAMGGLNYQIEHHLFPSMPRPTLQQVQPIVREYCELHDVTYTEVGLFASYRIVIDYLNNVGLRARDPFQCPLVELYRK